MLNLGNLKYYLGISAIFILDILQSVVFSNDSKFDIYLLYDHDRYLTNIVYDIGNMFTFSVLTYFLIKLNRRVFTPLFVMSLFWWVSYFVFYNQMSSLLLIPIYLILVVYYNEKMFR